MNLDNYKFPPGVKTEYTQRKFYNKYCYKIVCQIDMDQLEPSVDASNNYFYRHRLRFYSNKGRLLEEIKNQMEANLKHDRQTRCEGFCVSLFSNSEDDVIEILKSMPQRVVEVVRPASQQHIDVLDKNKKIIVRKTLFNDQFRYKIYFKSNYDLREQRYKPVQDWLENFDNLEWAGNENLKKFFYVKNPRVHVGWTTALYLNSREDLMMLQLRFNDDISLIEEIVLLSEVSEPKI